MTSPADCFQEDFPVPSFPVIFRHDNDGTPSDHADAAHPSDTTETLLPAIFTKDPREWTRFVDRRVEILLRGGGGSKRGLVYAIDPVSEAVVLATGAGKSGDAAAELDTNKIRMEIIPGHVIQDISVVSDRVDDERLVGELAKLFGDETTSSSSAAAAGEGALTNEELDARRDEVKEWLIANRIPVEIGGANGDVIQVAGQALIIKRPYDVDHCYSLNEIILKKVQQLLRNRKESSGGGKSATTTVEN